MPQKIFNVPQVGNVPFYKRRTSNTIKIRISGSSVKVSMPLWVPYKVAINYVMQRADWIKSNLKTTDVLIDGSTVGKNIILKLDTTNSSRFSSKHNNNYLLVKYPANLAVDSSEVQNRLSKYVINALQREAEDILLPLVRKLADQHNLSVNKIEIKNLKSRWGSCSSKKDLAFSLFLVQLPWHCINYVIYHELAHTKHMNHSQDFWLLVEQFLPDYKHTRKEMKQYSPHIMSQA